MAWSLVAHTGKEGNSSTVTSTGIDTTGATLIVVILANDTTIAPTISDSKGNMWNLVQPLNISGGAVAGSEIFYSTNPIVGASHTFTVNSTYPSICVLAFSGVPNFIEKKVGNSQTSGSTLAPGSVTPTAANALVITGYAASINGTLTINTGTISDQAGGTNAQKVGAAYTIQTSAAAFNPTWTLSGAASLPSASINCVFELGSSGGGGGTTGFASA